MKKGIYAIIINGKYYIGKDHYIERETRIKDHLRLLGNGKHYNRYLQKAFNKYEAVETCVLATYADITREELSLIEKRFIQKYDSYKNGYNLTLGGEGGHGLIITEERKKEMALRVTAERNPMAKLTNEQFFELVDLFISGKSNKFIGELYDLHDRYVSLIRHKHRFKSLWALVEGYVPVKSNDVAEMIGSITEEEFIEIINEMLKGKTNAEIGEAYVLSSGTASRIRNKKLYSIWWTKHFSHSHDISERINVAHKKAVKEKLKENGAKVKGREVSILTREKMSRNSGKSKGLSIDNVHYHSMMEAERQLGINRKVIAKRLEDELYPNYKKMDNEVLEDKKVIVNSRKSKKVNIDGIEYSSIMEASRHLDIPNRTISSRVQNESYPNYKFIEESENPLSKRARIVIIDGVEYRSVNLASTKLGIDKNRLARMLESKEFLNYRYAESE